MQNLCLGKLPALFEAIHVEPWKFWSSSITLSKMLGNHATFKNHFCFKQISFLRLQLPNFYFGCLPSSTCVLLSFEGEVWRSSHVGDFVKSLDLPRIWFLGVNLIDLQTAILHLRSKLQTKYYINFKVTHNTGDTKSCQQICWCPLGFTYHMTQLNSASTWWNEVQRTGVHIDSTINLVLLIELRNVMWGNCAADVLLGMNFCHF